MAVKRPAQPITKDWGEIAFLISSYIIPKKPNIPEKAINGALNALL